MYVLIAIIFIAELIIAGFILYWICKFDAKIKAYDNRFADIAPDIVNGIRKTRECSCVIRTSIQNAINFVKQKRIEFWERVVSIVLVYTVLLILRVKFKKTATFFQYVFLLKDFCDCVYV